MTPDDDNCQDSDVTDNDDVVVSQAQAGAWLGTVQAMVYFKVSERTLYRWMNQGKVKKRNQPGGRIEVWAPGATPVVSTATGILTTDGQGQTRPDTGGFFYLIQLTPDIAPGRIKVGWAVSPSQRFQQHRQAAPTAKLLKVWSCDGVSGEKSAIAYISTLGYQRLALESFDCPDIADLISRLDDFFEGGSMSDVAVATRNYAPIIDLPPLLPDITPEATVTAQITLIERQAELIERLSQRQAELAEQQAAPLRADNARLQAENGDLREELGKLRAELATARRRWWRFW